VLGYLSFYIPWASLKVNDCAPLVLVSIFLFMTGTAHWINGLAPLVLGCFLFTFSFYIPWALPKVNDYAPLVLVFVFFFVPWASPKFNDYAPLALDWGDFGDISPN